MENHTPDSYSFQVDGHEFTVDWQDRDLTEKRWRANVQHYPLVYAIWHTTLNKRQISYYLHRLIFERATGIILQTKDKIDHKDGNTLDCRRSNLRVANHAQNLSNRGKQKNGKNLYKGVYWDKSRNKYLVQIKANGILYHIGRFDDIELAHDAYCQAALKYHGDFARFD